MNFSNIHRVVSPFIPRMTHLLQVKVNPSLGNGEMSMSLWKLISPRLSLSKRGLEVKALVFLLAGPGIDNKLYTKSV